MMRQDQELIIAKAYSDDYDGVLVFQNEENIAEIVKANLPLIEGRCKEIIEEVAEKKQSYASVKCVIFLYWGTNRQDERIDRLNNQIKNTASAFDVYPALAEEYKERLAPHGIKVELVNALTKDWALGLQDGDTFTRVKTKNTNSSSAIKAPYDSTKASLFRTQSMHFVESLQKIFADNIDPQNPFAKFDMEFNFMDDRSDIIDGIKDFYSVDITKILLLQQLKVNLYLVERSIVRIKGGSEVHLSSKYTISGTGEFDPHYRTNLLRLNEKAYLLDQDGFPLAENPLFHLAYLAINAGSFDVSAQSNRQNIVVFINELQVEQKYPHDALSYYVMKNCYYDYVNIFAGLALFETAEEEYRAICDLQKDSNAAAQIISPTFTDAHADAKLLSKGEPAESSVIPHLHNFQKQISLEEYRAFAKNRNLVMQKQNGAQKTFDFMTLQDQKSPIFIAYPRLKLIAELFERNRLCQLWLAQFQNEVNALIGMDPSTLTPSIEPQCRNLLGVFQQKDYIQNEVKRLNNLDSYELLTSFEKSLAAQTMKDMQQYSTVLTLQGWLNKEIQFVRKKYNKEYEDDHTVVKFMAGLHEYKQPSENKNLKMQKAKLKHCFAQMSNAFFKSDLVQQGLINPHKINANGLFKNAINFIDAHTDSFGFGKTTLRKKLTERLGKLHKPAQEEKQHSESFYYPNVNWR